MHVEHALKSPVLRKPISYYPCDEKLTSNVESQEERTVVIENLSLLRNNLPFMNRLS